MRKQLIIYVMLLASVLSAMAQEKIITGTVISGEDDLPLIGATVVVKGTTTGTITDFDGKYSIKVPEDAQILQYSFVGLLTKEVEIADRTVIDVVLEPDILEVEAVVVTAFNIPKQAKALGYAVQDVESEQIARSNNDNIVNSLSGKVAGVHVNSSSGAAGASTFIEIRGAASISRSNRPLFVIDGIPIDGGGGGYNIDGVATSDRVGDLNPDDIENVSILKGGAASALYGMRAANGVVIITTKKGSKAKDGRIRVNVHSSLTISEISQVPELQDKYVQGSYNFAENIFVDYFGREYGRINSPDGPSPYRAYSWGPHIDSLTYTTDPDYVPFDAYANGYVNYGGEYVTMEEYMKNWDPNGRVVYKPDFDPANNTDSKVPSDYFNYNPDLSGGEIQTYNPYDFFQKGKTYTNSINISGGDEKANYYLSFANTQIESIIPNNTYVKNNFKFSAQSEIFDKLTATTTVNYMQNEGNRIQQGSNLSGLMVTLTRTPINFDNSFGYVLDDGETQRSFQGDNPGGFDNPYWVINNIYYRDKINRMVGNIELKYDINSWATITYKLGTDWYHSQALDFFEIGSNEAINGSVSKGHSFSRDLNSDLLLNINKDISDNLNINLLLGQNLYQTNYEGVSGFALGMKLHGWDNIANTNNSDAGEASLVARSAAYFGSFDLSYKRMLYSTITGRYEGSTTLPEGENWFFYPSISLGFIFTELAGLKDNPLLPYGKLRGSYAITANTARVYSTYTRYNRAGAGDGWTNGIFFPFRDEAGFSINSEIGNNNLKPEKQKTLEFGAELKFVDNQLWADIGYFINTNEDLLISAPVPASSGHSSKYMNIGNMETKGFELSLGFSVIKTSDINWDIQVNFDNPRSIVTFLADSTPNISIGGFVDPQIHAVIDQPYRIIWGTKWLRDEEDNIVINDDPNNGIVGHPVQAVEPGKIGEQQADYRIGISNTLTIKGLTISALIDIKRGGQMWNGTKGGLYYFGRHKDTETRDEDKKIFDGVMGHLDDNGDIVHYEYEGLNRTEVDGPGSFNTTEVNLDETWYAEGPGSAFTGPVEDYVEDADWFRLRELSVSYNFTNLLNKKYVKNLEIYFTGKNLLLVTPYSGVDPETSLFGNSNAQGVDYFNMPGTKSYSFGIKLGF